MPHHCITNSERHHAWSQSLRKTHGYSEFIRTTPLITHTGLAGEPVQSLFEELYPKLSNRAKKPTRQAFQVALLVIANALTESAKHRECTGFVCPSTNTQRRVIKRYKRNDFSINKLASVLMELSDCGLLERYNGYRGAGFSEGLATLWMPTKKAQDLIGKLDSSTERLPFRKSSELVWLKNDAGKLKDYIDDTETNCMRSELTEANELRRSVKWSYRPALSVCPSSGVLSLSGNYKTMHPEDLRFKRQFTEGFKIGGRYYGGVQQLRQLERSTITINGSSTVEYDIKSMHMRMLYNLKGLPAPFDGYDINGLDRATAKKLALIALNASSEKAAAGALVTNVGMTWRRAKTALESFSRAHRGIAEYMFTSSWRKLQYLDSELARAVQLMMLREGIPLIPVHDSFITNFDSSELLEAAIQRAYSMKFGYEVVLESSSARH